MRKMKLPFKQVAILFLSASFSIAATAQNVNTQVTRNPNTNNKVSVNKSLSKLASKIFTNPIPYFSNIKPTNNPTRSINEISSAKEVGSLPAQKFTIHSSSVNGVMTARNPYINNMAYLEFINADVNPDINTVDCHCDAGVTSIKLVLEAQAGKRYLITTEVSPSNGKDFGLSMYAAGYIHNDNSINQNNKEVSVVISPESAGKIELWMQCSDPMGAKRPWRFHSMQVKEIE